MEEDFTENERRPQSKWKKTSQKMEDDLIQNGRRHTKTNEKKKMKEKQIVENKYKYNKVNDLNVTAKLIDCLLNKFFY